MNNENNAPVFPTKGKNTMLQNDPGIGMLEMAALFALQGLITRGDIEISKLGREAFTIGKLWMNERELHIHRDPADHD